MARIGGYEDRTSESVSCFEKRKELDDCNPTKSDRKDPKTMAMLVKNDRYMAPNIPVGIYRTKDSHGDTVADCKEVKHNP